MGLGFTEQMTESISIPAASLPPANYTAGNQTVGEIDASKFKRIMAHVNAGVIGGGNIAAIFQASAENNANFANVSGANTLTLSTSNREGTLELRSDQIGSGNRYVRLLMILTTGPANFSASVFGSHSHYSPANDNDAANITRYAM